MKTALICGVSGQDGAYLAEFLLSKGYSVIGTSRDAQTNDFSNLKRLGIHDRVKTLSMTSTDFRSVLQVLTQTEPDEIYNLAGQTSVGLSFELPVETYESITVGTLNLLEAIRFSGSTARLYNAGSGECFGETNGEPADENRAFRPRSPYATAKAAAQWTVTNYRESYNIHACTGILFNHESPLRPTRFVTRKVVSTACAIAAGTATTLTLGNIDIRRDWGWAPDYVEAMWMMLQIPEAEDFVIATGECNSLRNFCQTTFEILGLELSDHLRCRESLLRPSDIGANRGDPTKARTKLHWEAKVNFREVIERLVEAEKTLQKSVAAGL